ncbi:MAG: oligopeptide/dipeptide ABC transporter ATP-binding protein [Pseudomonadota bacterium]
MTLLTINGLELAHEGREAGLSGLDLALAQGARMALVSERGAGAMALPALLRGEVATSKRVTSGEVLFESEEAGRQTPAKFARRALRGLVSLPQDLAAGFDPARRIGPQMVRQIRSRCRLGARDAERTSLNLLARYGIADAVRSFDRKVSGLSPAEVWRAGLAVELASEPLLIVAQAPFTGLDPVTEAGLWGLIRRHCLERSTSLLLLTAELSLAAELVEAAAVLYAGRVVEQGPLRSLVDDPRHPYTASLGAAMSDRRPTGAPLGEISGAAPDPSAMPTGCAFHPRCEKALAGCYLDRPDLETRDARQFACFWPLGAT